jgi:hypothetical protein
MQGKSAGPSSKISGFFTGARRSNDFAVHDFASHQSREFTRIKVTGYAWLVKSSSNRVRGSIA